ncbi:hypothetical protein O1611_g5389 [Lasiodiplodia mahajangana]|uniref:Uncharacterized protein n=1 Tax=Lasiodiplodia mahajangana TaxID=1108764 RepID=A0ACC2JLW8_9PEZI|nr:hypothetical protein O1611_g5389 [Lasiodiplodia mahajangana]
MAYNQNHNCPQGSMPGGASWGTPEGYNDEPSFRMETQIHPAGVVPSDEALLKSLYFHFLHYNWELIYSPPHDGPEQYPLTPSLSGRSIWMQRMTPFFNAHREIRRRNVYHLDHSTFMTWIEGRFNPRAVLAQGAHESHGDVEDRCFVFHRFVFWLDPAVTQSQQQQIVSPPDTEYESNMADYFWPASGSDYYLTTDGMSYDTAESSMYEGPNLSQRVQDWQDNIPRR